MASSSHVVVAACRSRRAGSEYWRRVTGDLEPLDADGNDTSLYSASDSDAGSDVIPPEVSTDSNSESADEQSQEGRRIS